MHLLAIKRKDVRILIFIGLWMKGFSCERREHYWLMSTDLWHTTSPDLVQLAIGVYAINVNLFKMCQLPTTFSWHFSPQNLKDVFFFMLNCTKWPPADENVQRMRKEMYLHHSGPADSQGTCHHRELDWRQNLC